MFVKRNYFLAYNYWNAFILVTLEVQYIALIYLIINSLYCSIDLRLVLRIYAFRPFPPVTVLECGPSLFGHV